MILYFTIPGTPKAKARARVSKSGFSFTPKPTKDYDVYVKECFLQKFPEHIPITGVVRISIQCLFPRPKSHHRTGKYSNILKDTAPKLHTSRPDLDNIIKSITDGLNGIAFKDDSQIWKLEASKEYTDTLPKTTVIIIND